MDGTYLKSYRAWWRRAKTVGEREACYKHFLANNSKSTGVTWEDVTK